MAIPAENGPKRCLQLLKDVRYLFGQYLGFFRPVSASSARIAHTLNSLKTGIHRFDSKHNTGKEPLSVFCQLTLGLSDTLIGLKHALASCAREYGSDSRDANDWLLELDAASMERLQTRLNSISVSVEIINEAMEMLSIMRSKTCSQTDIEQGTEREFWDTIVRNDRGDIQAHRRGQE